jgi:hypothetical protein
MRGFLTLAEHRDPVIQRLLVIIQEIRPFQHVAATTTFHRAVETHAECQVPVDDPKVAIEHVHRCHRIRAGSNGDGQLLVQEMECRREKTR